MTRVWAKRGTRPRAPRDQRYDWAYLFGAACPQRRVAAGLVMPAANAETMSLHLTAIGRKVAAGSHAALVLDGAGWGTTESTLDTIAAPGTPLTVVGLPVAQNSRSGFLGGGQAGYNFQSGWAVFGIQGDIAGCRRHNAMPRHLLVHGEEPLACHGDRSYRRPCCRQDSHLRQGRRRLVEYHPHL